MASIYSTKFAALLLTDTSVHTLYTVPSGAVAIVRSIQVLNYGTAGATLNIYDAGNVVIAFFGAVPLSVDQLWQGRAVLVAGDLIKANATSADFSLRISGYLLTS